MICTSGLARPDSSGGNSTTYPEGVVRTNPNQASSFSGAKNPEAYTNPENPPNEDNGALKEARETVEPFSVISNV